MNCYMSRMGAPEPMLRLACLALALAIAAAVGAPALPSWRLHALDVGTHDRRGADCVQFAYGDAGVRAPAVSVWEQTGQVRVYGQGPLASNGSTIARTLAPEHEVVEWVLVRVDPEALGLRHVDTDHSRRSHLDRARNGRHAAERDGGESTHV